MSDQHIADSTFGIDQQALTLLALLSAETPSFATFDWKAREYLIETETHLFHLGRKKGVCISVRRALGDPQALFVAFFEHGSSDLIVVYSWQDAYPRVYPPMLPDDDDARRALGFERATFEFLRIDLAWKHICDVMKRYVNPRGIEYINKPPDVP